MVQWHRSGPNESQERREAQQLAQYKGRTSAKGNYSGISETAWKNARGQEVGFWDGWLRTKGMGWKTTYTNRLNVSMPFLFQHLLIASWDFGGEVVGQASRSCDRHRGGRALRRRGRATALANSR